VWSDKAKSSVLPQPIQLDANGTKEIWFDGEVSIRVEDENNTLVDTIVNVSSSPTAQITGNYNLVANGSFELDSDNDAAPDNWTLTPEDNGTILLDSSGGSQNSAGSGLKFTSTTDGGGVAVSDRFTVSAGSYVYTSFAFKQEDAATGTYSVVLNWYKYDGSAASTASTTVWSRVTGAPTAWTTYNNTVSVPSDATYAELVLTGLGAAGADLTGSCWFDSVLCTSATSATRTLLASASASGDSELDFIDVCDAAYYKYEVVLDNVNPSAGTPSFYIAASDNSGSTWAANLGLITTTTSSPADGVIEIWGISEARTTNVFGDVGTFGARNQTATGYANSTVYDSIRVGVDSGNMTSGNFYVYGISPR